MKMEVESWIFLIAFRENIPRVSFFAMIGKAADRAHGRLKQPLHADGYGRKPLNRLGLRIRLGRTTDGGGEEAAKEIQDVLSGTDYRDGFLRLMQTMGGAVARISEQTETLNRHERRLDNQDGRLDGQDGRIEALKKELEEVRLQLATTQEHLQKRRKWWPFR